MNRITLSNCGNFVELWNNGTRIYTVHIRAGRNGIRNAMESACEYVRQWAGDENPEVSKELTVRMEGLESASDFCHMYGRLLRGNQ